MLRKIDNAGNTTNSMRETVLQSIANLEQKLYWEGHNPIIGQQRPRLKKIQRSATAVTNDDHLHDVSKEIDGPFFYRTDRCILLVFFFVDTFTCARKRGHDFLFKTFSFLFFFFLFSQFLIMSTYNYIIKVSK